MITLIVTYKCKPHLREHFLEKLITEGLDLACRAEAGNIKYDYYIPTENDEELLLVEKWHDADALSEHGKQPHYLRIGEIKKEFVNDTVVERFES